MKQRQHFAGRIISRRKNTLSQSVTMNSCGKNLFWEKLINFHFLLIFKTIFQMMMLIFLKIRFCYIERKLKVSGYFMKNKRSLVVFLFSKNHMLTSEEIPCFDFEHLSRRSLVYYLRTHFISNF